MFIWWREHFLAPWIKYYRPRTVVGMAYNNHVKTNWIEGRSLLNGIKTSWQHFGYFVNLKFMRSGDIDI